MHTPQKIPIYYVPYLLMLTKRCVFTRMNKYMHTCQRCMLVCRPTEYVFDKDFICIVPVGGGSPIIDANVSVQTRPHTIYMYRDKSAAHTSNYASVECGMQVVHTSR